VKYSTRNCPPGTFCPAGVCVKGAVDDDVAAEGKGWIEDTGVGLVGGGVVEGPGHGGGGDVADEGVGGGGAAGGRGVAVVPVDVCAGLVDCGDFDPDYSGGAAGAGFDPIVEFLAGGGGEAEIVTVGLDFAVGDEGGDVEGKPELVVGKVGGVGVGNGDFFAVGPGIVEPASQGRRSGAREVEGEDQEGGESESSS